MEEEEITEEITFVIRLTTTSTPQFFAQEYCIRLEQALQQDRIRPYLYDADVSAVGATTVNNSLEYIVGRDLLVSRSLVNSGISNRCTITAAQRADVNALADIVSGRTRCTSILADVAAVDTTTYNIVLGITVSVLVLIGGYFVYSYLTRTPVAADTAVADAGTECDRCCTDAVETVVLTQREVETVTVVLDSTAIDAGYVLAGGLLACVVFLLITLVRFVVQISRN